MKTPKEELLRNMSYSELKKHAQRKGIKRKMKSADLISLILGKAENPEDSFVAMEQKIINSCKKNKQSKFDHDKEVASDTPRRETYTLERPTGEVVAINTDMVGSSASPVLRKTPHTNETSFNVTMSRGSDRKLKKCKVSFVTPLRKSARLGSMTPHFASVKDRPKTPIPSRGSSGKKLSPSVKAKISFAETPVELKRKSSKGSAGRKVKRLSTPMPSSKCKRMNLSSSGLKAPIATPEVSFSDQPKEKDPENSKKPNEKKPVFEFSGSPDNEKTAASKLNVKTGTPSSLIARAQVLTPKSDVTKISSPHSVNPKSIRTLTPRSSIKRVAALLSTDPKNVKTRTPKSQMKKNVSPLNINAKDKRTPRSCVKNVLTAVVSGSQVKVPPNFKELHQKAFDKMESIDEYQQRKAANSAKKLKQQLDFHSAVKSSASKKIASNNKGIKKFGGIPFIPSVTSTKDMKLDAFSSGPQFVHSKSTACNQNISAKKTKTKNSKKLEKSKSVENTPLKRRLRFDVKASLSKKLPYKPHKGPLKPLTENLNTSIMYPAPVKPTTENKTVETKRVESRQVVRGVRMNRRFELQMQKRKLGSN